MVPVTQSERTVQTPLAGTLHVLVALSQTSPVSHVDDDGSQVALRSPRRPRITTKTMTPTTITTRIMRRAIITPSAIL